MEQTITNIPILPQDLHLIEDKHDPTSLKFTNLLK